MNNKYIIDLRQFNNGESDRITFPTFEQCLMYGLHKLKESIKKNKVIIKAILIEAPHKRKLVVTPSDEELEISDKDRIPKLKFKYDPDDNSSRFMF